MTSGPKGTPTIDNFRFENMELDAWQDGAVELEGLFYSVVPSLSSRMNDAK